MIFGAVYEAVMGKNTQQGGQSEKEDMGSRKKGTKRMVQSKLNSRYREQLITLDQSMAASTVRESSAKV